MNFGKKLIYNTALLTGSALLMRCIGLAYQVWLVGHIGAAGIGLFQLVMSVSMLATTFAISGIRFACTRLISQEVGFGHHGGIEKAILRCLTYSLFFGISAAAILFAASQSVGFLCVCDARTVLPLRILAVSLPFISLSSVFSGYFTAIGRVYKTAAVQISDQILRIILVIFALKFVPAGNIEKSCAIIVSAGTISEMFSFTMMLTLYILDRSKYKIDGKASPRLTARMLGVALPLAVSAYARTSLSTLQHLLVPRGLKSAGYSVDKALAGYGTIQGMVFPVIFFPSCFLMAISELIVPELTEAQVLGKTAYISEVATSLIHKCLLFSIGVAGLLYTFSDSLGMAIYNSSESGHYIRIFALLAPVMYMDMITDGMLKGLGQQIHSMAFNILDAAISVMLVYTVLPKFALSGYISIICFTECFNFALSIQRLSSLTKINFNPRNVVLPLVCIVGASQFSGFLISVCGVNAPDSVPPMIFSLLFTGGIYAVLLWVCGFLQKNGERAIA